MYSSFLNFNSTNNKGYFVTTEGDRNLLNATLDADIEIRTSGVFELKDAIEKQGINAFKDGGAVDIDKMLAEL